MQRQIRIYYYQSVIVIIYEFNLFLEQSTDCNVRCRYIQETNDFQHFPRRFKGKCTYLNQAIEGTFLKRLYFFNLLHFTVNIQ